MSPGLMRARETFRLRNVLTGFALGAFVTGVWAYSIRAVKQENFDDIDEEARSLRNNSNSKQRVQTQLDKEMHAAQQPTGPLIAATHESQQEKPNESPSAARGLLPPVVSPHLLDPKSRTLVWGAPPVDRIGLWGEKSTFSR